MKTELGNKFAALFGRFRSDLNSQERARSIEEDLLDQAIEQVVDGTEEKIRLVPGYKKKLKPMVSAALVYADQLVDEIPEPIDISNRSFSTNPYVNAFFANTREIEEALYQSSELRDYAREWMDSGQDESYALLCMRKVEKEIYGMELVGDDLVRDVPQTSVSFCDHRIYSPAPSEPEARMELRCCFFGGLIERALANIMALRAQRRHLEIEQTRLSTRLRQGKGTSSGQTSGEHASRLEETRLALEKIGPITPEVCLGQVMQVLSSPEQFVRLHHVSLNVDRMGIKVTDNSQRTFSHLDLAEAEMNGQPSRVVILARLHRSEVIPPGGIPDRHHRLMEAVHV